jgi:hypothetical protein
MKVSAKIISLIFHPVVFFLLMPYVLVYKHTASPLYALKWQVFSAGFIAVGLALFLIGRFKGLFSDEDIYIKEERHFFYAIAWMLAFVYLIAAWYFKGSLFPMSIVSLGIVMAIVIFDIVNYFIKASIHMATVTAFVTTITMLYGIQAFLLSVGLIPLLAWSRLTLRRHSKQEIIAGTLLGFMVTVLTFIIGRYIYYS